MDVDALLRVLRYGLVSAVVVRYLLKFIAYLKEVRRRAALLRALPGPELGKHEGWLGHINGGLILDRNSFYDQDQLIKRIMPAFVKLAHDPVTGKSGLIRIYGLNSSVPMNTLGLVIMHDIDMVRQVLAARNADSFIKGDSYRASISLIGDGILTTSGEAWAVQRPILERGVKHNILSKMMPKIAQTADELAAKLKRWDGKKVFNIHEEMLKLTMDVIGRVAVGTDFHSVFAENAKDAIFYDAFDTIIDTLCKRASNPTWPATAWIPTERNVHFNQCMEKLEKAVNGVIDKRIEERKQLGTKKEPVDLLDFLCDAMETGEMKRKVVMDNIKTLLFAGHDTTAAALSWMMYLLAKHPEHANKIREEADRVLGKNVNPTYEQLEKLDYLTACMLETFRLYPSAGFTRNTTEDFKAGDYIIPANTEIMILPYLMHRNPKYYPDRPNDFVPERWLAGGSEYAFLHKDSGREEESHPKSEGSNRQDSVQSSISRHGMTRPYLPFSLGHRNCVGRPLSFAEIRTSVIIFLRNFDWVLKTDEDPKFSPVPVLQLTLNPSSINAIAIPRVQS